MNRYNVIVLLKNEKIVLERDISLTEAEQLKKHLSQKYPKFTFDIMSQTNLKTEEPSDISITYFIGRLAKVDDSDTIYVVFNVDFVEEKVILVQLDRPQEEVLKIDLDEHLHLLDPFEVIESVTTWK